MSKIRPIAFYLPQYHPIPENNEWWGNGFTEWTNVTRARPQFPTHYQPHLPSDLGFYDLRLEESRVAQANLAREYGIHGFCYYHYWFNGRRILERPFTEVLQSGKPDFPFCLCWANENWTRTWDGGESHILLEQNYSHEDDLAHITSLLPAFADERYIRINNKPLFLVYRTNLLPNPKRTTEIWREAAHKAGIGDLYLARVESFRDQTNPTDIGFDASIEFAPTWLYSGITPFNTEPYKTLSKLKLFPQGLTNRAIFDYDEVVKSMLRREDPDFKCFRCVIPSWDNTARRPNGGGMTIINSTPEKYSYWLSETIKKIPKNYDSDENLVFVNAWNEWAEGTHLEPDAKWGRAYLEATKTALSDESPYYNNESPIRSAPPPSRFGLYAKYHYDKHIGWRTKK